MRILGIETSCDETAVAIVDKNKNILSNLVLSQTALHQEFGGVVPELAARSHSETIDKLITKSLQEANLSFNDVDAIAATSGPGLIGGVIVGMMAAKTIASVYKKPFIAVNHLEAHALTIRLVSDINFPYFLLLVSGGHCQILVVHGVGKYQLIGGTIDDALGEAFDKVAQMLGLGYPGGPMVEEAAKFGDENYFNFPKPLLKDKKFARLRHDNHDFDFSFSGLKTAVRRKIEQITGSEYHHFLSNTKLDKKNIANISASFQKTIAEIIINRLENVINFTQANNFKINNLVIAGGVAANQYLYKKIFEAMNRRKIHTLSPPIKLCTDNAAMVAWVGVEKLKLGLTDNLNFKPKARWNLNQI